MGTFLVSDDLSSFASIEGNKANDMIDDAEAMAVLAAPCLATPDSLSALQLAGIRAILRGAILRWHDAGSGGLQQQTESAGPFASVRSFDNRQQRRGMFWPSEIVQLQDICGKTTAGGIFAVDTAGGVYSPSHADICSLNFGATYCSCGAVLTGAGPLYEV